MANAHSRAVAEDANRLSFRPERESSRARSDKLLSSSVSFANDWLYSSERVQAQTADVGTPTPAAAFAERKALQASCNAKAGRPAQRTPTGRPAAVCRRMLQRMHC